MRYWSRGGGSAEATCRAGGSFAHRVEGSETGMGRRCPRSQMEEPWSFQGTLEGFGRVYAEQ